MANPARSPASPTSAFWSAPFDLLSEHEQPASASAGFSGAPGLGLLEAARGGQTHFPGPRITRDTDVLLPDSEAWGDHLSETATAGSSSHNQTRHFHPSASGSGSRMNAVAGPSTLSWSVMNPPSPDPMNQDLEDEEQEPPPTQLSVGFDIDTDIPEPPPSQPPSLPPSHNPSLVIPQGSGPAHIMIIDDDDDLDARDMEELERTIGIPNDGSFTTAPSEASRAESVDPHRQPRRMADLLNPVSPSRFLPRRQNESRDRMSTSTDDIQILDHDPFGAGASSSSRGGNAGAGPGPSTERARKRQRVVPPTPPTRAFSPEVEFISLPSEPKPVIIKPKTPPKPVPTASAPLSQFNCPICFSPPTRATLMPCGHVCCGECLFTSVKTMQRRNAYAGGVSVARCPVCRAEIAGWDGRGGGVIGLVVQVVQPL